jgi:hypothetical protein
VRIVAHDFAEFALTTDKVIAISLNEVKAIIPEGPTRTLLVMKGDSLVYSVLHSYEEVIKFIADWW